MAQLKIPRRWQSETNGHDWIEVEAQTIGQLLDVVRLQFPTLINKLVAASGQVQPYINLYRDGDDVRYLQGLQTLLQKNSKIEIVVALAGG
jgi:molybdopterin synthase sulfur carrier subunit